jgi:hypothetical protein
MNTLLFLLFCLAIGYVCVWVLVNERRGNADGDWGFIAMRKPKSKTVDQPVEPGATQDSHGGRA